MEVTSLQGEIVRREDHLGYVLIEEAPICGSPSGLTYLETKCEEGCARPYRVTTNDPKYESFKDALGRGDRSDVHCYHIPWQ